MARESKSVCARCRRAGEKLFLKGDRCLGPKCAFTRRSYAPGKRGTKGFTRKSEYGLQLNEKQKAKNIYGLLERPFRNYYLKATKSLNAGQTFLAFLEMRLDNVIKRSGLTDSIKSARQLVVHEHIKVNGQKIKSPNYNLKVNDTIEIEPKLKLTQEKEKGETARWLKVNYKNKKITVASIPERNEMNQEIDEKMIVELYSR